MPDIVAKRGDDLYVIEVKANTAVLPPLQRTALDLARKYGFHPKVIHARLTIQADCEEEDSGGKILRGTRLEAL